MKVKVKSQNISKIQMGKVPKPKTCWGLFKVANRHSITLGHPYWIPSLNLDYEHETLREKKIDHQFFLN